VEIDPLKIGETFAKSSMTQLCVVYRVKFSCCSIRHPIMLNNRKIHFGRNPAG